MSRFLTIHLINKKNNNTRSIDVIVSYDIPCIEVVGSDRKFCGDNMYSTFKSFNAWLQKDEWIPLCNGARIDASVSGMVIDSLGGASVYLHDELDSDGIPVLVDIFGKANSSKVGTIDQQEQYNNKFQESGNSSSKLNEDYLLQNFFGCLLGLACGDAVGTTVEFKRRGSFPVLKDMVGGGPFNLQPGQWTDDTSMALCLAESLTRTLSPGDDMFDPRDQMQRYLRWRNEGYLSSTDRCFDIGNTVAKALANYANTGNPYSGPTEIRSAGNGSIMRLSPIAMAYFNSREDTAKYAELSSKTTHGAQEAVDACHLYSLMLNAALSGKSKDEILFETTPLKKLAPGIESIQQGQYIDKSIDNIRGSGYVVQSLEAALWCFYTTNDFRSAILKAANLGEDADTTAAVCGQIAGAFYSINLIPKEWIFMLAKRQLILDLANKLYNLSQNR